MVKIVIQNGVDIERISRFEELINKDSFKKGVYTEGELGEISSSVDPKKRAAMFFSAKEAVAKAFGRGLYGMLPKEIEIYHEETGRPKVRLLGSAAARYGGWSISLSASYKDDYVVTSCIAYHQ